MTASSPSRLESAGPSSPRAAPSRGVTFIVPVYDGAHTLDATLASILAQDDGRPFEVIAIDDGSRDQSAGLPAVT